MMASRMGLLARRLDSKADPEKRRALRGLLSQARDAGTGRGGDTILAHINPREAAALHYMTDGGSINPRTGLMEFDDGDDDGGYGDDDGWDTDSVGDMSDAYDDSMESGFDSVGDMSDAEDDSMESGFDDGSGGPGGFDSTDDEQGGMFAEDERGLGGWLSDQLDRAMNNPAETAINAVVGFAPGIGWVNTASGILGGPTIGGMVTGAARSATGSGPTSTSAGVGEPASGKGPEGEENAFGQPSGGERDNSIIGDAASRQPAATGVTTAANPTASPGLLSRRPTLAQGADWMTPAERFGTPGAGQYVYDPSSGRVRFVPAA